MLPEWGHKTDYKWSRENTFPFILLTVSFIGEELISGNLIQPKMPALVKAAVLPQSECLSRWFKEKNPAYGRHQLFRPMRIVGPIQFWRGCLIYLYKKNTKNIRFWGSTRDHRSAPKRGRGPPRNTSLFLGLYSRPPIRTEKRTRSTRKCGLGQR